MPAKELHEVIPERSGIWLDKVLQSMLHMTQSALQFQLLQYFTQCILSAFNWACVAFCLGPVGHMPEDIVPNFSPVHVIMTWTSSR